MVTMAREKEGKLATMMGLILACRLQQNRKSAKKCRLKKKAEFSIMKKEVM